MRFQPCGILLVLGELGQRGGDVSQRRPGRGVLVPALPDQRLQEDLGESERERKRERERERERERAEQEMKLKDNFVLNWDISRMLAP